MHDSSECVEVAYLERKFQKERGYSIREEV